ncbi:MAG: Hsp70 family protein [Planctomycetaceae bacterium]|nr:Hsp70 family protein [Planctomycetales bacterium]MCB9936971.1 Hsp70 family protein [Planctomycetaceae bacterium]
MGQHSKPAVGIDLGTTYSVVAHLDRDGKPFTLANDEGELTTPSVVFFDRSGTVVGREAIKAAEFEPQRVARFAKRDMGEGFYHRPILGNQFPPEVIQALILEKLKHDAELRIGKFSHAVITVPAYFNEPRRKATQDAGRLAGIEVLDIINEPTAAAIAYGVQQGFLSATGEAHERELILVYDLGGGTFDVTLMEIVGRKFNAIATAGDVHLGGIDWDQSIAELVIEQFQKEHGVNLRKDEVASETLIDEVIRVKHALTARDEATLRFAHAGQRLQLNLTRKEFEQRTAGLLDRTRMTVKRLLKDAQLVWSDLTRLLLVGGSTRMPMVQTMLEQESGLQVDRSLSPDEAVAHGAALYAGVLLSGGEGVIQSFAVRNVSSHDLGVMGVDPATKRPRRHVMIPRNSPLPCKKASLFKTAKKNQKNVVVRVVEGGTDAGQGATPIGKCVVQGLPPDLPLGTPVKVFFKYGTDGRLDVRAELPNASCDATTVIERAVGMSRKRFDSWAERLSEGFVIEEEHVPEEPVDVDEIEGLLDEMDGELEVSEDDSEEEATTDAPPPSKRATGDAALDDFLKEIG